MVGAHFDSWHSGTGATDNGAGSAVMIEVMRILKALNLNLDLAIRIAYGAVRSRVCWARRPTSRNISATPRP